MLFRILVDEFELISDLACCWRIEADRREVCMKLMMMMHSLHGGVVLASPTVDPAHAPATHPKSRAGYTSIRLPDSIFAMIQLNGA